MLATIMKSLILPTIGATIIITQSYIFKGFRNFLSKKSKKLGKLFSCPMCMGFWVGNIFFLVKILLSIGNFIPIDFYNSFLFGCETSLLSYIVYLALCPFMKIFD